MAGGSAMGCWVRMPRGTVRAASSSSVAQPTIAQHGGDFGLARADMAGDERIRRLQPRQLGQRIHHSLSSNAL